MACRLDPALISIRIVLERPGHADADLLARILGEQRQEAVHDQILEGGEEGGPRIRPRRLSAQPYRVSF